MIDRQEIDAMAERESINTSHVQRDYVHGWLLHALYSRSALADRLVLKGGNCLRKGYFAQTRYSNDLDFSTDTSVSHDEVGRELNGICDYLREVAGIDFQTDRTTVQEKRKVDGGKEIAEARLYFRNFYGKESSVVLKTKMDITQFDRRYLPVQTRPLIHPYSDSDRCVADIRCVKLEEVLATKMRCLLQRRHIADLYDLVYAALLHPNEEVNRREILATFFKITVFERSPGVAKGLLLDLPVEIFKGLWNKHIVCPLASTFTFEGAMEAFVKLINGTIAGEAILDHSQTFFPARLRNPIMEAAQQGTMLRVNYDGVTRMVEPYSLAFKIRKDGLAREYLYVYDTTGGWNSGPGMKCFVSGSTASIENTDEKYEPRYEVELRKAGGMELVERFQGRPRTFTFTQRGSGYRIQCPYCTKVFRRDRLTTALSPHKDRYGNQCRGRVGSLVY